MTTLWLFVPWYRCCWLTHYSFTYQGPCKKYSSCYFPSPTTTFVESELAMLDLYCQRAGVQDGMKIVDLGCGWGSLSLYLLEHYPNCKITAISNSQSQRQYIYATAHERQLKLENLTIITVSTVTATGVTARFGHDHYDALICCILLFQRLSLICNEKMTKCTV